jgi:hypothetical protein
MRAISRVACRRLRLGRLRGCGTTSAGRASAATSCRSRAAPTRPPPPHSLGLCARSLGQPAAFRWHSRPLYVAAPLACAAAVPCCRAQPCRAATCCGPERMLLCALRAIGLFRFGAVLLPPDRIGSFWAAQPQCSRRFDANCIASHRIASHRVQRVVEELTSGSARSRQRVLEDIRRITKRPRCANARGTGDNAGCSLRKGLSLCD